MINAWKRVFCDYICKHSWNLLLTFFGGLLKSSWTFESENLAEWTLVFDLHTVWTTLPYAQYGSVVQPVGQLIASCMHRLSCWINSWMKGFTNQTCLIRATLHPTVYPTARLVGCRFLQPCVEAVRPTLQTSQPQLTRYSLGLKLELRPQLSPVAVSVNYVLFFFRGSASKWKVFLNCRVFRWLGINFKAPSSDVCWDSFLSCNDLWLRMQVISN
jgi:hypothetical protein